MTKNHFFSCFFPKQRTTVSNQMTSIHVRKRKMKELHLENTLFKFVIIFRFLIKIELIIILKGQNDNKIKLCNALQNKLTTNI